MGGGPGLAAWLGSVGMSRIWPVIGSLASWYPMGMGPMPGGGTGGPQGELYGGPPGGPGVGGQGGGGPLDQVLGPIPWVEADTRGPDGGRGMEPMSDRELHRESFRGGRWESVGGAR